MVTRECEAAGARRRGGARTGCGRPRFDVAQRALSLPKGDIGLRAFGAHARRASAAGVTRPPGPQPD